MKSFTRPVLGAAMIMMSFGLMVSGCPKSTPKRNEKPDKVPPKKKKVWETSWKDLGKVASAPKRHKDTSSDGWVTTRYKSRRKKRPGSVVAESARARDRGGLRMAPKPAGLAMRGGGGGGGGGSRVPGLGSIGSKGKGAPAPSRGEATAAKKKVAMAPRLKRKSSRRKMRKRPTRARAANPLTAGETDDNKKFDDYIAYHRNKASLLPESYRTDVTERYVLRVRDKDGQSLPNCRVTVSGNDRVLWKGRTDSNGRLLFFPRVESRSKGVKEFLVNLSYAGKHVHHRLQRKKHGSFKPHDFKMPVKKKVSPVLLEVVFLLDTTGSMADEIARIQATLLSITAKIREMQGKPKLRFGMVLYRDRGDAYVTRRFAFTEDIKAFDKALSAVKAGGGGDYAESMNLGLHAAVNQMQWSQKALRLVFLVADAPPHTNYDNDVPFPLTLKSAVFKGIKIFPTAASGLDAKGSYVMRQIAQFTGGRFLFIKYGAGTSARHGIHGPSKSNNLDDIVLRIVREELKAYTG